MGTINDWVGTVGGTILGIELIVVLILLVAINGALALGLLWVLRKMGFVHEKVTWASKKVHQIVDKSANVSAAPIIRGVSFWRGLQAGLHRATHWSSARETSVAKLSPPSPEKHPRAA